MRDFSFKKGLELEIRMKSKHSKRSKRRDSSFSFLL